MKSPITGKEMTFKCKQDSLSYRGVKCKYTRAWWEDEELNMQFTTTEMDEEHLRQIHWYWQSTRSPHKKENKIEKTLRDLKNKYKSWYQQEVQCKMGGGKPNSKRETELLAKIELLTELQKKLL